jgi:hypothetical protein
MAYVLQQTKPLKRKDAIRVFEETIAHGPEKVSDEFRRECLALANAKTIHVCKGKVIKIE